MSSSILNKLNEIKTQKDYFITPENLAPGVNVFNVMSNMSNLGDLSIEPNLIGGSYSNGYVNSITINAVNATSLESNLSAINIANGIEIFGITGTYEGATGGTHLVDINIYPATNDQSIVATSPIDGYNIINVAAVNSSIDINITADNIKSGVSILGITGNYEGSGGSGDVKLFNTMNEMQNSQGNQDGDLAVVYKNTTENLTAYTEFQVATFPERVILPSAFMGREYFGFQAVNGSYFYGDGELSDNEFTLRCFSGNGEFRIEYDSVDGITYDRKVFTKNGSTVSGNDMDFETIIRFENGKGYWNDMIGYFMQISSTEFNGLFQYETNIFNLAKTQLDATNEYVYGKTFYGVNGVSSGLLGTNSSYTFADVDAEVYSTIQKQYDNMGRVVMYDGGSSVNSSLFYVPARTNGQSLWDTTNMTGMNSLFYNCRNLMFVSNFDTSHVTDMGSMFTMCPNLTSVPNFDTNNVVTMSGMFSSCDNLTSVPNFNTSNVTSMFGMFSQCRNLTSVPNFDTNNVTDMISMFAFCDNLTSVPTFNTNNVADMSSMFASCRSLTSVPNFDTNSATAMAHMFDSCQTLTSIPSFNTDNVTNMEAMFRSCVGLNTVPNFNTSNIVTMKDMFSSCENLTSVSNFDTNNVTDMSGMFWGCSNLTSVPNFNTSNVTNMRGMFSMCYNVTSIPNFDTSNVVSMSDMFYSHTSLVSAPNFDTSNVYEADGMYAYCSSLVNVPDYRLSNYNPVSVAGMFASCNSLSNDSIQNIINMLLNSQVTEKILYNDNYVSPFRDTIFDNSYYQNRWDELTNAGWQF